ncbi:MAG: exodeoxyribonuclease V subunit beta [Spirochaetota bacterium]
MNNSHSVNNFREYSLDGINCIEASAGTGKTYTISHLYLRLIIEKGLSIDNILVVTFTNAATDELRSRIRSLIKIAYDMLEGKCDDAAKQKYSELYQYLQSFFANNNGNYRTQKEISNILKIALADIDQAHIYTIHSFCSRTLAEFAFESRSLYGSNLIEDETPFMKRVIEDFYYSTIVPLGEEFIALFFQKNDNFVNWFMEILRKLPEDPDITILPDISFKPEIVTQLVRSLNDQIAVIRKKFNDEFGAIQDNYYKALAEGVLNGKSYKEEDLQTLQEAIQRLSQFTVFQKDINKYLKKFSVSGFLDRLKGEYKKKEKEYHWHEFFTLLEECRKTIVTIKIQIIAAYREFIQYSEKQYSRYRDRWNIISFRDILKDMHKALQHGTESRLAIRVRERFKAALIDEFQDTDPLQYAIFTTIFKKEGYTLYIIGDPKQAIYSFRGADVFAYIKARQSADKIYTLTNSYRSTPSLSKAINYIFGQLEKPFVFDEIAYHPVESKLQESCFSKGALSIWFIKDTNNEENMSIRVARKIIAKNIAREIQQLVHGFYVVNDKQLQYSDIAILVRTHHEAELVQDILRQCGINSVLYSRQSVFTTPEIWELLHVLEAIINPSSTVAIKRALVTSLFGYNGNDIIEMEEGSLDIFKMRCATYLDIWKARGVIVMLQRLLHDDAIVKNENETDTVAKRLLQYYDGERVITNILHCAEILADVERQKKLDTVALVEWLKKAIYVGADTEEQQLRLESDANAVKIVTIHASKGLEYPIVFCPYLFDTSSLDEIFVFHDSKDNDYRTHVSFKFDKEQSEEMQLLFPYDYYDKIEYIAKREQLAESLRIAYVAMTRAKIKCYVGWGSINNTKTSALRYLFHFNRANNSEEQFMKGVPSSSVELMEDLKNIERDTGGVISVKEITDITIMPYETVTNIYPEPKCVREIEKPISQGWQLTSYTSLSYRKEDEKSDEIQIPVLMKEDVKEQSIFTFPAGSISGLCIHKIFETIDFKADSPTISQIVSDVLNKYNIDTVWTDVVTKMVSNVLTVQLQKDKDLVLSKICDNKRHNEIEFYYPVEQLDSRRLVQLFNEHSLFTMDYASALQQLSFENIAGFMHGYIDMVFEYQDAYYIVDWKTNLLGTSLEDYHYTKLRNAIILHLYFLQYSIYTIALHRYLQTILKKAYQYDKHFGGVFYIFVRGVDANRGNEYGIFFDKPDAAFVQKFDKLLGELKI